MDEIVAGGYPSPMLNSGSKKGRPVAFYRTSWGDRIDGLTHLADGRWKVSGPKAIKFTEPDERLAIARFKNMTRAEVDIRSSYDTTEEAVEAFAARLRGAQQGEVNIDVPLGSDEPATVSNYQPSAAVWAWFREQILTRAAYVAQMTGIEQIGYLADLERPTDSPKMAGLVDLYAAKPGVSPEEVARCKRMWGEFVKIVSVKTLRELTHEHVELYEQQINQTDLGPKSIKHRYTRVKTIIAHALKRGRSVKDCRAALDKLAMLEVPTPDALDPDPIHPGDFWAIHAEATKAGNATFATMMLFSLNAALYPSEAGAVQWDDIDLKHREFATRRNKTKVPRVAVLWPETVKALTLLSRDRSTVFNTSRMAYQRFSVFRDWKVYRTAAKLEQVKYAQIRDASFTTACRVSLDQARVLAGHRLPGSVDHYVLRAPGAVTDACAAIRAEFIERF